MKRIFISALAILSINATILAQSETDLFKFSRNDFTGTARSMSMGGAFGALGGDISGVAINPAGIGVYKSSEIVATMNFRNNKIESDMGSGKLDKSKFQLNFDNVAFVGAFPLYNDDVPFINVGFSYNKIKNFDKKYRVSGSGLNGSLTGLMADQAYGYETSNLQMTNNYDPFGYAPWLAVLGYNGGLIDFDKYITDNNGKQKAVYRPTQSGKVNSETYIREKGSISSYDFNVGTTISDMLSFGVSLAVTDIDYRMYSDYKETFENNNNFYLENWLKTEATGWQVKTGVIFKPINELRIGVAYHSPTWYESTDYYSAKIDALGSTVIDTDGGYGADRVDYDFKTPDKWTFSLAGVIGQTAIISADYELTNYKNNMKFRNEENNSDFTAQNSYIKEDYKNASALRVGAEIRFTPRFSGRVGYAWMQSPLEKKFKNGETEVLTAGSVPHFVQEGDANYFTYGLGYKITSNFYADVAFVLKTQTDKYYAFTNLYDSDGNTFLESKAAKLKTNMFSGLLTIGYKF